jgi:signal transduction histidine kinase
LLKFTEIEEKLFEIEKKSEEEKDKIRRTLYIQTKSRFNSLKNKKLINIEYILPNNIIFLKMEDPLNYGNTVNSKKETVKYVQKNKKPTYSYEIEDFSSGYSFTYPIMRGNSYLGVIAITFSEEAITSSLMNQYDVLSNFILKNLFDKEFLEKSNIYQKAHFDGFIHNKNVLKDLKISTKKKVQDIKPSKDVSKLLYYLGQKQDASSVFIDDKNYIVTIIPVYHTILNTYEGFISIISKGTAISIINNNYFTILFLFIFLYLTVTLLFLQEKIKVLRDKELTLTMIKKDQQLLEQAKMAQMGEMIGNIAHQWRQPLSAISTIASGTKLNQEFGILKKDDIPKNMDLIVENTKYLSQTIDTFRDFIKERREEKEVIIQDKIDESLKIVQATLDNSHIKLIKNIDYENIISTVMISEDLSQVIINILNNAKDAILIKNIEDGWIKISQKTQNKKVIIEIEDNAGGIKEDILPKIFDPYFTTKHQFQGTGLGLYMSKIIIEKHLKGNIKVKNTENGALFTIELFLDSF